MTRVTDLAEATRIGCALRLDRPRLDTQRTRKKIVNTFLRLWVLCLLLGSGWAVAVPACVPQLLSVQAALPDAADGDQHTPPLHGWQAVSLPDDWSLRWPQHQGAVWYRVDWMNCPASPSAVGSTEPVALGVNWMSLAGAIYSGSQLLFQDVRLHEPLPRSWNMPRYWLLPAESLQAGHNTLWFRVVGYPWQIPGLGEVTLGPLAMVQAVHQRQWWTLRTLPQINLVVSATLGMVFLGIWLMLKRAQPAYGWYAAMSAMWVLFSANVLSTSPWPFDSTLASIRANGVALLLYVGCFCRFTWQFGDQQLPRAKLLLRVLMIGPALLLVLTPASEFGIALKLVWLTAGLIFFANCLQFIVHALRQREGELYVMASCLAAFVVIALYDSLQLVNVIPRRINATPISGLVTVVCMSTLLGWRVAESFRRAAQFNEELRQRVVQAQFELSSTLSREHGLALSHARLQERLKLSHDLHDGLGGSLVRYTTMLERGQQAPPKAQVVSMLKQLRDDLRQVIDQGSSQGTQTPSTPAVWLAPIRHRYTQLFEVLGIRSEWLLPGPWLVQPSTLQCLVMTRLVEEAMTNIVKHSQARSVVLQLLQPQTPTLVVVVEDDGVGFDVETVLQSGLSVGVRSMRTRLARLGGELCIVSRPGHTRLTMTIPLDSRPDSATHAVKES